MYAPLLFRFVAIRKPRPEYFMASLALSHIRPSNKLSYPQIQHLTGSMKKSRAVLHTAQLLTGVAAAVAAYALKSSTPKRRPGQVVLITGGSRGLGLALAERYGRSGAKLSLAARDIEELIPARHTLLDREAVESPDDVLLIPADLTDASQALFLIDHA